MGALVEAGMEVITALSSVDSRSAKEARLVLGVSVVGALLAEVSTSCGVAIDGTLVFSRQRKSFGNEAVATRCKASD